MSERIADAVRMPANETQPHPKGDTMSRTYIDSREMPSENNCNLAMSGRS
jgi:hypothetical protein